MAQMVFTLELYDRPESDWLDVAGVCAEFQRRFPHACLEPGDLLQEERDRVAAMTKARGTPEDTRSKMMESLQAKARRVGPARRFRLDLPDCNGVRFVVRRCDATFWCDAVPDQQHQECMIEFLRSLRAEEVQVWTVGE